MFYLHLLWYRYWTQRNKHRYRYSLLRNEDLQEPYETPDPDEDLVLLAPESDDELTEEDSDDDEESEDVTQPKEDQREDRRRRHHTRSPLQEEDEEKESQSQRLSRWTFFKIKMILQ